jgi:hypothetical protein
VAAKPEAQPRFWAPLVPFLVSGLQHKRTVNGDVDNPLVTQFERARSATKSISMVPDCGEGERKMDLMPMGDLEGGVWTNLRIFGR